MNFTHYTLGEALSSPNETIKRNAFSILKQLQKDRDKEGTKCRHGVFRLKDLPPCRECVHNERNRTFIDTLEQHKMSETIEGII